MYLLLLICYLAIACFTLLKVPFIRKSGLSQKMILLLFGLKLSMACLYGYFYYHYDPQHGDTWEYFETSLNNYHLLLRHPADYFHLIGEQFRPGGYRDFFGTGDSFWQDAGRYCLIQWLTCCNIFSGGRYYINCIFFSWFTFFGCIALYRLYRKTFSIPPLPALIPVFFFPAVLFWTNGIHKDGVIFCCLGLLLYAMSRILEKRYSFPVLAAFAISLLGVLLIRNYLLVALLPGLAAWYLCKRYFRSRKAILVFPILYLAAGIFTFTAGRISPLLDLPQKIIDRKDAFYALQGNSALPAIRLTPDLSSFVRGLPAALDHVLLRPYPGEIVNLLYAGAVIENCLLVLFCLLMCFRFKGFRQFNESLIWLNLFFALSCFLLVGYIVPFLGAILRYRSIPLAFLLMSMIALTNWKYAGANQPDNKLKI